MRTNVDGNVVYVGQGSGHGDGTAILMLHGAGMDHTVWTLPARHFARHGYRVIAPDLPGHGRSGGQALESIEALARVDATTTFVVIGEGDEEYIQACKASVCTLGLERRVWFHPFVPHHELYELLVDVDVSLGLYAPTEINTAGPAPNKVFESLAAGAGVIVTAGNSLAEEVVSANVGLAVDHRSPRAIADGIRRLVEGSSFAAQVRTNARAAHLEELNYEHQLAPTVLGRSLGLS